MRPQIGFVALAAVTSLLACGDSEATPGATSPGAPPAAEEPAPPPAAAPAPPAEPGPEPITGPLAGPVGEWKWHDIEGAVCGNGDPTGIGVSVGTGRDVLIYLEGGGACWNELTCSLGGPGIPSLASYVISGYHQKEFEPWGADPHQGQIWDRTLANNPYKDASLIYVPYCTGDFHAGSAVQSWPISGRRMHHVGRQNLDLYLAQIVATFGKSKHVTLSGSSAGGFGSQFNFWRVKEAFGSTRVDLVSDSGPLFNDIFLVSAGSGSWHLTDAFPPGCADCKKDYRAFYPYYANTYPSSRFAFLSYSADGLMHIGALADDNAFNAKMKDLTESVIGVLPNTRYFLPTGTEHTMLYSFGSVKAGGVGLADWLTEMKTDAPTWGSKSGL